MEDCDQSKVFVGGISWETTEDVLNEHFRSYGTVVGSVIAKDRTTGSPRGFAFVSFSDASALDKVLIDTHTILGRTVEVKRAVPRSEQNQNQQESNRGLNRNNNNRSNGSTKSNDNLKTKKIFVGGLSANLTEDNFKIYFEKFGRITDVVVMHDNITHRPRGFGFITFDSEDSVEEVMQKSFHELCGKLVEVKRAVPKDISSSSSSNSSSSPSQQQTVYRPRFEVLPHYGPLPGYGIGGYPPYGGGVFGGGGFPVGGYGLAPVSSRVPWGGPAVVRLPLAVYPAYLNGGHELGMVAVNGYNGIVGAAPGGMASQLGGGGELRLGGSVDSNSLGSSGGEAAS